VADADALGRHRAQMFLEMGRTTDAAVDKLTRASAAFVAAAIPGGAYVAWVAAPVATPTHIVAGAGVQRRTVLPRPDERDPAHLVNEEALIVNVYTDPAWRRRGIAELLMRHILAWTHAEGITRVVLHASAAGRPMYERLGFVATNEMRYDGTAAKLPDFP
jgi:GNAT superfamily N-acetyltransferase